MPRLELKRIIVIALAAATVLGLLASVVVDKVLGRLFRLPEDAVLLDIAASAPGEAPPEPEPAVRTPPIGVDKPDEASPKLAWVTPIVQRSIFDSTKVDQGLDDPNMSTEDCRKTDLNVVLYATIVADPETFSSALIGEEKSDSFPSGYGVGDEVQGKEVYKIEQKKVVFNVGGVLECLTVVGEEGPRIVHTDDGNVHADGDNKFVVDESLLQEALANPEALATQIRAVPHKGADGNIDGYRLSGIRKDSVFEQLGVKNGDIIHSVNGKELTSVSSAMEAYSSLQSEKAFTFDITRRNERQTMDYEVR